MSVVELEEIALVVFAAGVGVHLLVSEKTVSEIARVVGAVAGILFAILVLVD